MRISIIGAGNVGGGLATAAAAVGHDVTVAAAHEENAVKVAENVAGAKAAPTVAAAAQDADVDVLGALGDVDAVVVDATNPLNDTFSDLTTSGTSHAEQLAAAAPGMKLVKAFNTVFASRLGNSDQDGQPLDGFYAGDDEEAKATVQRLLTSLGFRPIDAGGLRMARALEEMAFLNITLNVRNGWSWQSGWKLAEPSA